MGGRINRKLKTIEGSRHAKDLFFLIINIQMSTLSLGK